MIVFGGFSCVANPKNSNITVNEKILLTVKAINPGTWTIGSEKGGAFKCSGIDIDFEDSKFKEGAYDDSWFFEDEEEVEIGTAKEVGTVRCVYFARDHSGQIRTCWMSIIVNEADPPPDTSQSPLDPIEYEYANPVNKSSFTEWLLPFLRDIQGAVVYLVLAFIAVGGFIYMLSAGNVTRAERAKSAIISAITGFIIIMGVPTLVFEVLDVFSSKKEATSALGEGRTTTFLEIGTLIMNTVLSVAGILFLIGFVVFGLMYLMANGNVADQEKAKKGVYFSIIGVFVATSSLIIIDQIIKILSTGG